MSPDVILDANVLSLYLFLWRHWEMISDLLFNKFLSGSSNNSSFSVRHRLQRFEVFFVYMFLHKQTCLYECMCMYVYIHRKKVFIKDSRSKRKKILFFLFILLPWLSNELWSTNKLKHICLQKYFTLHSELQLLGLPELPQNFRTLSHQVLRQYSKW